MVGRRDMKWWVSTFRIRNAEAGLLRLVEKKIGAMIFPMNCRRIEKSMKCADQW